MTERSIIFSGPMVRAILTGSKSQTRRVVKFKPWHQIEERDDGTPWPWMYDDDRAADHWAPCPHGQPGDRLWVREAWAAHLEDEVPSDRPRGPRHTMGIPAQPERKSFVFYRADGPLLHPDGYPSSWYPSIHMPRKYSRITLEITGVRVERLQDISEDDAKAEGIEPAAVPGSWRLYGRDTNGDMDRSPRVSYRSVWESLHGPGAWAANPWVWVIEFKRLNQTGTT